ncbi:MAG: DegV family protein [Clostridiales bacterium]|nr:DegV family protein [Clostridiales bacterium]
MNFILATDSTCDLSKDMVKSLDIAMCDLLYYVDDVEYGKDESTSLEFHEFYEKMRNGARTSTSMVNEDTARAFLTELLKEGKDILYLAFDSALSGTYDNFVKIAKELNETSSNKIAVVDSLCAAGGEGLYVTLVDEKRKSGASFEETCKYAEEVRHRIMHYFIVDDLKYLARGGRLSKGSAFVGNIINIKPVLHVDPVGKLVPFKKVFGRKKSIKVLLEKMIERYNGESKHVYISHGDCYDEAKSLADAVKEKFDLDATLIPLDYVIGSHSGPGTLTLFFTGNDRAEKD